MGIRLGLAGAIAGIGAAALIGFIALPVSGRGQSVPAPRTLIGMQYESYFTPHGDQPGMANPGAWKNAEAIPLLGKYSSFDVKILKQHEAWFEYLGIDWLLLDWSNQLAMAAHGDTHSGADGELEQSTALLFHTYAELAKAGKHPPKLVLMLGMGDLARLNEEIAWTKTNFLDKPEYKDLWLNYEGKPLLTINDHMEPCPVPTGIEAPGWTMRFIGTQLQDTKQDKCGMWSWMDGPIRQVVTYKDGQPEEVVVASASFGWPEGWLGKGAFGHLHGYSYLESWKVAFETRPHFIQLNQWNEFDGSTEHSHPGGAYVDIYNAELSNDMEPTRMDACAYRGCGGWGYYYMNLTKALISLDRKETPEITVLALAGTIPPAVVTDSALPLRWSTIGPTPSSYTLKVDAKIVAEQLHGESYTLNLLSLAPGKHHVMLQANGVHTYFDLAPERLATRSPTPLKVTSAIDFIYKPAVH
jgi:hypothetical protein